MIDIVDKRYPLIPLRGLTIFPNTPLHFDAGRAASVVALEAAMNGQQLCVLVSQKDATLTDISADDLYEVGTIVRVKQLIKLTGETVRAMVEGIERVRIYNIHDMDGYWTAEISLMRINEEIDQNLSEAYQRELIKAFDKFCRATGKVHADVMMTLVHETDPHRFADLIASTVLVKQEDKQKILEIVDPLERMQVLIGMMHQETEIRKLEANIQLKVKKSIEKGQREYYLREQIKVIRTELGEEDNPEAEAEQLKKELEVMKIPQEVREKVEKEIARLTSLPMGSHELPVLRTWIDWVMGMPWDKATKDRFDLPHAREILDAGHFGMEKVKERMIEHLAVCKLKGSTTGTIICLVGPPGVGKTSIASSVAEAIGRKFVRMSLGGIRDEAEIRGHRRTYIGAMPGRLIKAVKEADSMNPIILLDEIDKLGMDHRGDPADALLEVLDPAQNFAFKDHYLEVPFDLSGVMFITTANTTATIPRALLDRMEVVELSSYTAEEKLQIAKRHLLPKQIEKHALTEKCLRVPEDTLADIIAGYTREAGVRSLERRLAEICRKAAAEIVEKNKKRLTVTPKRLKEILGPPRYRREKADLQNRVGVVTGLAWTSLGGETLCIEAATLPGNGKLQLTGQLGSVMKESAQAAYTYARAHAAKWGIDPQFYRSIDIHIHIPEGAIPKDGPSAGVSMTTAIISALNGVPVRGDVAMTGEVTLSGNVLPIGGLKEKTIAAHREGIKMVIIPKKNEMNLQEIPDEIRKELRFSYVQDVEEVLKRALCYQPEPFIQPPADVTPAEGVLPGVGQHTGSSQMGVQV